MELLRPIGFSDGTIIETTLETDSPGFVVSEIINFNIRIHYEVYYYF
jgi:hypothetical protein